MSDQLTPEQMRAVVDHGRALGHYLAGQYPPVVMEGLSVIPDAAVPRFCDAIMVVVAEVIQAYIDAGSEREATMENEDLWHCLEGEFGGWAGNPME